MKVVWAFWADSSIEEIGEVKGEVVEDEMMIKTMAGTAVAAIAMRDTGEAMREMIEGRDQGAMDEMRIWGEVKIAELEAEAVDFEVKIARKGTAMSKIGTVVEDRAPELTKDGLRVEERDRDLDSEETIQEGETISEARN